MGIKRRETKVSQIPLSSALSCRLRLPTLMFTSHYNLFYYIIMYKSRKITRKNRRGGTNDLAKTKCENTFCKKYVDFALTQRDKIIKMYEEIPLKLKTKQITDELKNIKSKKGKQKTIKTTKEMCSDSFCNIGCKGTIFEPGTKVPDSLFQKQKFKDPKFKKIFKTLINQTRANIFGKKTNVLKDNFYEKIIDLDNIKKKGAISGCAIGSLI